MFRLCCRKRPPDAESTGEGKHSGHHEVGDLNPAQISKAEQAERHSPNLESCSRERLNEHDGVEKRSDENSAKQQTSCSLKRG